MVNKKTIIMGGIIKHTNKGIGFKITFPDKELANHYKDMIRWIIINDNHPLVYNFAYYDMEEYKK